MLNLFVLLFGNSILLFYTYNDSDYDISEWNKIEIPPNILEDLGYVFSKTPLKFSPHLLGVPQIRERVFILAKNTIDFNCSFAIYSLLLVFG